MLTVGSLFSGIEGFGLGLERAGMRVLWHCEDDEFCRRVIARHWPENPIYPDVRELTAEMVEAVDVVCAGWPCPGFSVAGLGQGFDHEGSGLWSEVIRLVRELRPRYVVLENVAALLGRGVGRVFGDLAACGYDAEWDCIPASAVGAPHRRDRLWVIAYPSGDDGGPRRAGGSAPGGARQPEPVGALQDVADTAEQRRPPRPERGNGWQAPVGIEASCSRLDDGRAPHEGRPLDDAVRGRHRAPQGQVPAGRDGSLDAGWWVSEPDVGRVAHGVPDRVDRLAALGNALVPQIAEWLGRRIVEAEEDMRRAA